MLTGNLATRPFYNERLVTAALVLLAAVAVALSVGNGREILALTKARAALQQEIDADQQRADRIRAEARTVQQSVDRQRLTLLATQTREANRLIDLRTFSWVTLLGLFERTLPYDVKLVAVSPTFGKDYIAISMNVIAKRMSNLSDFTDKLENVGGGAAFYDVEVDRVETKDDGTIGAAMTAYYLPPSGTAPGQAPKAGPKTSGGRGGKP